MKKKSLILITVLSVLYIFNGCTDKCGSRLYYTYPEPVYMTTEEIRDSFSFLPPVELSIPGKIYMYNDYLFVNEVGKGVHIINNVDKRNPVDIGFVNVPGNFDMAVKGNILYVDNYVDLLAIDISNIDDVHVVKRLEGVFNDIYHYDFLYNGEEAVVVEYREIDTVWYDDPDCSDFMPSIFVMDGGPSPIFRGVGMEDAALYNAAVVPGNVNVGIGGSMARFAIVDEILYTVGSYNLGVFDISVISDPIPGNKVDIGWNIETIFPYGNNLFIGSMNGMYVYDISEPSSPEYMSTFSHVTSCDPVVVNDEFAFVTLRNGTPCQGFTNQLDVIDIKNLYNPQLVKSYPMENPHGLGLDGDVLFICEGDFGLKIFNASDIQTIDTNLIKYYKDINAFDVIPYNNNLIMIGMDGLYQYDYSVLDDIQLLSHLPIVQANE